MTADAPEIIIGSRKVGSAHPPLFWPDIDLYFHRDEKLARRLIDTIAAAGGGYLKGAALHRADLCLDESGLMPYFDHLNGKMVAYPYRQMIEDMVVPLGMLERLLSHGRDAGLEIVLSVYDEEGVCFAEQSHVVALKIPSSNITHKWLIERAASTGLPLVIDTGRSRWFEIDRAIGWAEKAGGLGRLLIQHSPPGPPATAERFHMRMLAELSRSFACPVGLSDHHAGLDMLPLALALGACVFEKGVVAERCEAGIDRAHAIPADRLAEAIKMMHSNWMALGHSRRPDGDAPMSSPDRMGCVAARTLTVGEFLTRKDIEFAFPVVGAPADEADRLVGRKVKSALVRGQPITPADLS
ncbi:N-acetylneuraminate synthase family protein [Mesorhizobium sp. RP14(2022)]|uniref:N-acetylneuraminate synthase family protein n=1 Tax=Mesorhizobium liriopis TaxID=2953882 RepID=A0ABT1C5U7_9HYPH|nr:N-acetylneuraminate synthase family protein [Mesorhizobium liriopis]MCO6050152.1 N-acetylneuraminate synthase family protein [Mesorhizobium liriopis]